jgi:hypothetical protein
LYISELWRHICIILFCIYMDPLFAVLAYSNVTPTQLEFLANVTSDIQGQLDSTASAIVGAASSITTSNLTASRVLVSDASGKVAVSSTPASNVAYVSNLVSDAQVQLNSKQPTITGAASSITTSNVTPSRVVVSDASGKVAASNVPSANVAYITNVTSDIQTQLNTKADLASAVFTGDVGIQGNLTVAGNTTTLNTEQLTVADPVVVPNSAGLNQPSGVYIRQATGPNVAVVVQNNAVDFLATTANATSTSFAGAYMPVRVQSVSMGNSTLTETSNILQLQKNGANVLVSDASVTTLTGNVRIQPVSVGQLRSVGGGSVGSTHTITPAQLDTVYGGSGTFGGHVGVFVSGPGGSTGYALSSLLKSSTAFEVVPLLVHKSGLTTLALGMYQANVRIDTDAGCTVFWTFEGAVVT